MTSLGLTNLYPEVFFLFFLSLSSINFLALGIDSPLCLTKNQDFPGGSDSKASAYSTGDPCSIPGSGRSPGEGNGNPLQYSWTSLVAQMVEHLPTMWKSGVQSLGQEDPLENKMATHSSTLA